MALWLCEQNAHKLWYVCGNTLIDFSQTPIRTTFDSIPMDFSPAYASICNPITGNMLLYTMHIPKATRGGAGGEVYGRAIRNG
jgi:hypothetical protein